MIGSLITKCAENIWLIYIFFNRGVKIQSKNEKVNSVDETKNPKKIKKNINFSKLSLIFPKVILKIFFRFVETYFYVYDIEKSHNLGIFIKTRFRLANHRKK